MAAIELFVIGASAGGIEALRKIVAGLGSDLPAAVCIVVHIAPQSPGLLPDVLNTRSRVRAVNARDGQAIAPGRIYVGPPDHHLVVDKQYRLRHGRGPKENRFRPAVDPLFRSAALVYGERAAGIVLSGGLNDGAAGLVAIKRCGGIGIVQEPEDALSPSMPIAAMRAAEVDHRLPAADMAALMIKLANTPRGGKGEPPPHAPDLEKEVAIALGDAAAALDVVGNETPSIYTCPECHGTLFQMHGRAPERFRCHTGHAFTAESLIAAIREKSEDAVWSAVRSLHEQANLLRHLAESGHTNGDPQVAARLRAESDEVMRRSLVVQAALARSSDPAAAD
jgi:two-component system chemotaxis response regulator CheB